MRTAPKPAVYGAEFHVLAKTNRGAREAMNLGMSPSAVAHYATHWPQGIGVGVRATEQRDSAP